jgi:hypothetical protein
MAFARSLALLCILSLLAAAGLCVLIWARYRPLPRGAYAALVLDAAIPDRTLRELLAPAEAGFGGPPVSESSQWVLLDEFDGLARIPLDRYANRIAPFDPRNDGYAERLRSFFVRGDKRLVFIPLRSGLSTAGTLRRRIAAALGDIPFELEYPASAPPLALYAVLFALACAALPLFKLASRFRFRAAPLIPCLPALAPGALCGAPGFALAALLLGLGLALEEPLLEWRKTGPSRRHWRAALLFLAGAGVVIVLSGLPLPLAGMICAVYAGTGLWSIRIFALPRVNGHVPFVPVPILRLSRGAGFTAMGKAAGPMLPFALAALTAALVGPLFSGAAGGSPAAPMAFSGAALIGEAEYRAHAAFQSSFSRRPLGGEGRDAPPETFFPSFERDPDGLISPVAPQPALAVDFPPFPLKALMDFIRSGEGNAAAPGGFIPALLAALIPLLFVIPAFLPRRRAGPGRSFSSLPRSRRSAGTIRRRLPERVQALPSR